MFFSIKEPFNELKTRVPSRHRKCNCRGPVLEVMAKFTTGTTLKDTETR